MKKHIITFLIAIFFLTFLAFLCVFNSGFVLSKALSSDSADDEIVVYISDDKSKSKKIAKDFRKIKKDYSDYGVVVIDADVVEIEKLKEKKQKGEIRAYGYSKRYQVFATPNDPEYVAGKQWGLTKISAPSAWDVATGDENNIIAILDTGFQLSHSDLSGRFVSGYDFVDDDSDPSLPSGGGERYYHGTLVAGVIAATTNNNQGIAGVDWNSKIMPLRVMDNDGYGYTNDIAAAINYAKDNGAKVINMSLGYDCSLGSDPVLEAAIESAYSAGVTIVAASGNEDTCVSYPAAYSEVIAVGATDSSDVRADYPSWGSNYGPELDVVAPGVNIYTTNTTWNGSAYVEGYSYASGTSLAAPFVSGVASLLVADKTISPDQVATSIQNGADKVDGMGGANFTNYYGYGRANAENTLIYSSVVINDKISLNSFRITMEDVTTPEDDTDYVLASNPAIGEPVSVRAVLKNANDFAVDLTNIRIKGLLSSGTQFIVGTVANLTLDANSYTAVPVQSFNISSFYTHTFSIDYEIDGNICSPYVKPTYSYQQIKAHFPNVKVVKTPAFVPSSVASYSEIIGVTKIKNYDERPAYIKNIMIRAKLGSSLFYFAQTNQKIEPGKYYYYEDGIIPYKKGTYDAYVHITYGNGSQEVPASLSSTSSYGHFTVY